MTTTILTPSQIDDLASEILGGLPDVSEQRFAEAIEQAVLQSEQVQALRRDAEAFRLMVSFRLTVKVDEVCSDVEVFHLGECLAWPPAHHCENDEEVAAVAREAIQKAVATLKEQT